MTELERADANDIRPTSPLRTNAFRAMQTELETLRAANSQPRPAADKSAVDLRLSQIDSEIRAVEPTPKDSRMTAPITKVGGDVEQRDKAEKVGMRWYAGLDANQVYRRDGEHSYFVDLVRQANPTVYGAHESHERLQRNMKLRADQERALGLEQRTQPNTTNGTGGEFVPPLWLEQEFIAYARPGRITADLMQRLPMPEGTDTINLPKVATGTAVANQVTQNTGIQETDITTTSVASPVATIAGGQTVSLQLMEQSPINIDGVILSDLARAYAVQLDSQVLSGSGANGYLTGLTTLSGTNAVTFTASTPALTGSGSLYSAILKAANGVQTGIFAAPDAIIMHPRRWAWCLEQVDTLGRPILSPRDANVQNGIGSYELDAAAQGYVGTLGGIKVYTDAMIPTNLGAGTNQDQIIVTRGHENWLWESDIRAEAFQQTYAQNMSVFLRLYNYAAFAPGRYPQAISVINGTGLIPAP